jgi:hypothetical protein
LRRSARSAHAVLETRPGKDTAIGQDASPGRPPLAWHKDSVLVYVINTTVTAVLLAWSLLTDPSARTRSAAAVIGGSLVLVALAWLISFLLAGLPFHRPTHDRKGRP